MESQHQTTSPAPGAEPQLCSNNCGFFGNSATEGLCSKCWRDAEALRQKSAGVAAAAAAAQASEATPFALASALPEQGMQDARTPAHVHLDQPVITAQPCTSHDASPATVAAPPTLAPATAAAAAAAAAAEAVPARPAQANKNRCYGCNKKIGLLGFECRCGFSFCATHRHAADHACTFDYASMDKARLAAQNPMIAASKLDRL